MSFGVENWATNDVAGAMFKVLLKKLKSKRS